MTTWNRDEIRGIAETDDLHIAPFREDRKTYGTLTWIWSVVVDGHLYARAYNGTSSRWYRAKYRHSPYLEPMISDRARAATVEVMPRESDA